MTPEQKERAEAQAFILTWALTWGVGAAVGGWRTAVTAAFAFIVGSLVEERTTK